ncbi:1,4-dihydroxy-6-naphthoate synthase [Thermoflavifilum aggregans]|uniref:1,4-dihydroxy-6-naphtoate synthase n=1 Tax=Thermoflavifilum aggregans TaxID=454188 RepID=A0A2M9CTC7_9BACT|nr:1,4-dihydroxy-6-naphthoate synthase [Thermoflavifilum aggregans]PJJ75174.1 1,4-dihydroxy-6-naphthoate synthase [Thermoflavifilum aggregans]
MKLSLGFSPCPNDTFIFDALVNHRIDTGNLEFEVYLEDVETLNQWAKQGKLDITKLSCLAYLQVASQYVMLDAGSALGKGCGPLLIAARQLPLQQIPSLRIAIPGVHTTANMLLHFAFPDVTQLRPMLFSEIEDAILRGDVDAGVIIHENRFTYQQKGLVKLLDLGDYWEQHTGAPIPLGCIAMKRSFPPALMNEVNGWIRKSLEYAYAQYPQVSAFVRQHAQAMDEQVMRQHIDLYVNEYSLSLQDEGKKAIAVLQREAIRNGMLAEATSLSLFAA